MVDFSKTMSVVSTTLTGLYCALIRPLAAATVTRFRFSLSAGLLAGGLLGLHVGAAHAQHNPTQDEAHAVAPKPVIETGAASYYGKAHQGRRTASGERFDDRQLTAAHPWLPFGTKVKVTLLSTGRSVVVEITDRLHSRRRIVDLSLGAAQALGMVRQGVAIVALTPG